MDVATLAQGIVLGFIEKSGVKEWASEEYQDQVAQAALRIAQTIFAGADPEMAVTAVFRQQFGTPKVFKSSGGDGAVTLASLANGAYRQTSKIDFGATLGMAYAVFLDAELAATPTAGNTIDLACNPSSSGTASTDNRGGCSGTDSAYTGYSSNAAAAFKQLPFVGSGVCTTQATANVQKMFVGIFVPAQRFNSFVLLNGSGAAFHSSDANCVLTFTPMEGTSEPS
jgi:hypothetical protein